MHFGMNVDIKARSRTLFFHYWLPGTNIVNQCEQVLGLVNRRRPSESVRLFTFGVTEFNLLLHKNLQIAYLGC